MDYEDDEDEDDKYHDDIMEHLDGCDDYDECPECTCANGCDECLGISNRDFW